MAIELSGDIFEKYSNVMKIPSIGAKLFHADARTDGQTDMADMTGLIVAFRSFPNVHKMIVS
jgi:hypothetical protein